VPALLTTSVGSFPKPPYLQKARNAFARGDILAQELEKLEERATREVIALQEELGIDVLVDGEMYRGDMATYFAENLSGFAISGLVRSYGNRYYRKPIVTGPVQFIGAITVQRWKFAQSLTEKPMKAILTGPYTMMDWSFNEYYDTREETAIALAQALHEEVQALFQAGARHIQVDEPALSVRPDEVGLVAKTLGIVTKDIDAKFYVHVCYGDFHKIYPRILELPCHHLDLELANSQYDLFEMFEEHPFTKELGMGVIDVHTPQLETVEQVKQRILNALEYLPPDRIMVDPDCGLKTRTWDEAKAKLTAMVEAVRQVKQEKNIS
jgi:5-methyltetrahydropteroyltriglutamate--homocysteine methyltransferase